MSPGRHRQRKRGSAALHSPHGAALRSFRMAKKKTPSSGHSHPHHHHEGHGHDAHAHDHSHDHGKRLPLAHYPSSVPSEHKAHAPSSVPCAIVTVSDSKTEATDR